MRSMLFMSLFLFGLVSARAQSYGKTSLIDTIEGPGRVKKTIHQPLYLVDSIVVTPAELNAINPNDIAAIDVYKDSSAFRLAGERGKNGLIYIETKKFARKKYWSFFISRSDAYSKLIPTSESDSLVVYILNNQVLKKSFEYDLSKINDQTFVSLSVIDAGMLRNNYNVSDKSLGVVIVSKSP